MKVKTIAISLVTVLLFGCATYPVNREEQAIYHVNKAQAAISKDERTNAANQIEDALARPTGDMRIRELFASNPKGRDYYLMYLEGNIAEVSNADQANAVFEKLSIAKSARIFSEDQIKGLFTRIEKTVAEGNLKGSIPFDLSDQIDNFQSLKNPVNQKTMLDRSIHNLQNKSSEKRNVKSLIEYVQRVGRKSDEGKKIESLLPTLNIRRDELDLIATVSPTFAATRKKELTTCVFLQIKGGDRIFLQDILQTFQSKIRGVEWVSSPGKTTTTLTIERVRHDERTLLERSETITYAQHEVNMAAAVLLMPRNASYLYEVISGGAEIEYGFVVTAAVGGKTVHDEIVRGKVGGEYRRCQNKRIQNVYGGVSSASFDANDDMKQKCSGPSSISIEELRSEVLSRLTEGVLKVPTIELVQDLN